MIQQINEAIEGIGEVQEVLINLNQCQYMALSNKLGKVMSFLQELKEEKATEWQF